MMKRHIWFVMLGVALLAARYALADGADSAAKATDPAESAAAQPMQVEMFQAMQDHQLEVKFIAKSDHAARVLLTNKTKQPLSVKLPEAFVGAPVLAQFGGGGRGGGGRSSSSSSGNQSSGGGFGGGGMGGGGGMFSIPPEQTGKIDVATVCLDHGLRDPSSSKPYEIVPAEGHVNNPAVIELLKAFGRGELEQGAAQAAAWHLNSNVSWQELAAKRQGTRRSFVRPPYFTAQELRDGLAYANQAVRRAQEAGLYDEASKPQEDAPAVPNTVERSTTEF